MKRLAAFDTGFLNGETRAMPMHVGSLMLFRPPDGAPENYIAELYADAVAERPFRAPFNQKLEYPPAYLGLPHWTEDEDFDIEYHVRHSALPRPGRYRELFALISRLHSTLLDRSRPLWEFHLIEGLETEQFAAYVKIHHAVIDGVAGMRLLQSSLSENPDERGLPYVWSAAAADRKRHLGGGASTKIVVAAAADRLQSQLGSIPGAVRALTRTVTSTRRAPDTRMAVPFQSPRTALNTKISGARRFVAQSYSLERIHRVRDFFGATVNDVILGMCASALRHYLEALGELPERPLTAMTPVSIRPDDADDFGNAVSAVLVNLATHIADPQKRMETIQASMADAKELLKGMSYEEISLFTMLMMAPVLTPVLLRFAQKMPSFNVVISNVPGPQRPLYLNGARLDGMYPVSIVAHGMAVNITVTSYVDSLDFGITACRRSVPHVQRLIDYLEVGLRELEQVAGIG